MAALTKTVLIGEALEELNAFGGTTFTTAILGYYIPDILRDFNRVAPVKAKDTANVVTVADSKIIDLSAISDILGVRHVEYPADEDDYPMLYFRNVEELEDGTYRMGINFLPEESAEEVYVYYDTIHVLTDVASESTLTRQMEGVVVLGLKYYALNGYAESMSGEADTAKTKINVMPKFGNPFGQYMQVGDQKKTSYATVDRAKLAYDKGIATIKRLGKYYKYNED